MTAALLPEVVYDPVEDLIVTMRPKGILTDGEATGLLAEYLIATWHSSPPSVRCSTPSSGIMQYRLSRQDAVGRDHSNFTIPLGKLRHRREPLSAEMVPPFGTFMNQLKGGTEK